MSTLSKYRQFLNNRYQLSIPNESEQLFQKYELTHLPNINRHSPMLELKVSQRQIIAWTNKYLAKWLYYRWLKKPLRKLMCQDHIILITIPKNVEFMSEDFLNEIIFLIMNSYGSEVFNKGQLLFMIKNQALLKDFKNKTTNYYLL